MKPTPEVSVIINCLNGEPYLREAMDSVFAQTFQDWDIVFWDNASTDGSARMARSYGERVRYFRSETTFSLGKARNLAIQQARGDYIALLDCDDLWMPTKLEKQVGLLARRPEVALCYSNSVFFDSRGDLYDHFSQTRPKRGMVFQDLLRENFISSETMVFRKEKLDQLDYVFDEELTLVMDYDLSLRLAYRHPFDYVEEPLSKWRMHEGSESRKKRFQIPVENRVMLEKLIQTYPGVATRCWGSVSVLMDNVNYQLALERWDDGSVKEARRMLRRCKVNQKVFLTYLATYFMPFAVFDVCKERLKRRLLGGLSCRL